MVAGTFIKSTPLLNDTYFEGTVIYITEYDNEGAVGFVVNSPFERKLNELVEFKHIIPFALYEGGPVDTEHLFFIHRTPGLITGGTLIANNVYVSGDFAQAVKLINSFTITAKDIKLFIGYCGWNGTELDEEIAEGSWEVLPPELANVYLF